MSVYLYERMTGLIFEDKQGYRFFLMSFTGWFAFGNKGTADPAQTFFMIVYRMVKYTIEEGNEDVYDGH